MSSMRLVRGHAPATGEHRAGEHTVPPRARQIAAEIELTGAAQLAAAVPEAWLDAVRRYADGIDAAVPEVMLEGTDASALSFLRDLTSNPDLLELLDSVAQVVRPSGLTARPDIECALRVVNGVDATDRPLWLHYDASILTMVLPIEIPDGPPRQSGELILCPNHRPYRRWALTNVIEKAITQSDAYRQRFLRRLDWNRDTELVPLKPGNAYLFWGYRSYHASMPVAAGARRVTVIVHYRDAHARSRIVKYAKAFRHGMDGFRAL